MTLALVDELRSLPPPLLDAALARLEAELGPAGVAALAYDARFWLRPEQRVSRPLSTIEVFVGERGTGKSHAARELFAELLEEGGVEYPRIVVATNGAIDKTVFGGTSGFKRWTPPHVRCEFRSSTGYAGDLFLGPHEITVCTAAAPAGGIGPGYGLTWADDPAAWVEAVGAEQASTAWNHVLKSNRQSPGILIVATTPAGAEFLWRLLTPGQQQGVRLHDLGKVENNATNLEPRYLRDIVPALRAAGEWDEVSKVGAFAEIRWRELRVERPAKLTSLAVSIDPAKSSRSKSCEVGLVGTGIDERGIVYGIADRSRVMSAAEWPAAAHDLLEELADRYRVPVHFVIENNAGGEMGAELLRAEERRRRLERGKPGVSVIEIREVTSRPRESKVRRASPVVALAKSAQVRMLHGLGELEGQLSSLTDAAPGNDRADAFVHGARDLAGLGEAGTPEAPDPAELFKGFEEAQRAQPAPAWGATREASEPEIAADWDRV